MGSRKGPAHGFDHFEVIDALEVFADYDPVLLASLRTPADEDAIVAALETQLALQVSEVAAQRSVAAAVIPFRLGAFPEQRAA